METKQILKHLRENPEKTIGRVAYVLNITEIEVTKAQCSTLKHLERSSPIWGKDGESVAKNVK